MVQVLRSILDTCRPWSLHLGGMMDTVPEAVIALDSLTSLSLDLQLVKSLPTGSYLQNLEHVYLGGNLYTSPEQLASLSEAHNLLTIAVPGEILI